MYVTDKIIRGELTATVKHKYSPTLRTFEVSVWVEGEKGYCLIVGRKSLADCIAKACRIAVERAYPTIFG